MKPNWKLKTLPTLTLEAIVERLLTRQQQQNKWLREVQASGHLKINEPISQNFLLLDLALDVLGVPPENMPKDGTPLVGEAFCREWLVDLYELMFEQHNDVQTFIEVASGKREMPGEWTDESL